MKAKNEVREGFTLVELMAAVSILASGIALVVRSFSSIAAALDNCDNRVAAVRFMAAKMAETELREKEEAGVAEAEEENSLQLGNRAAVCINRAAAVDNPQADEEDISLVEDILTVSWKEGNKNKNAVLAAYFKQKKEE
jgi:prepilin-type N-terminal cleavage/methylation domain-containing protein